jgi:hypothetical protein
VCKHEQHVRVGDQDVVISGHHRPEQPDIDVAGYAEVARRPVILNSQFAAQLFGALAEARLGAGVVEDEDIAFGLALRRGTRR